MRVGLTGRMVIASGLLAIIVGGAFAAVLVTITDLRGTTDLRRDTREALVAADTLEKQVIDLETGLRGFVITRDDGFLEPTNAARAALPGSARTLERLAADEPVQLARVRRIVGAMNDYERHYVGPLVAAVRRNDPSVRSVGRTNSGKQRVDAIRQGLGSFRVAERARLSKRDADVDTAARRATAAAAVGIAGSILLILGFGGYLTRVIVQPLRRAAHLANRLAGGDLSARMQDTDVAEIGALERSFNVMAGSLEKSRDELAAVLAEQAALRRVATLVARGAAPAEVFAETAKEVGRLLGTNATALCRYEPDGTATLLALETDADLGISVGARISLEGENAAGAVLQTGRAARQESFERATGTLADLARVGRMDSSVGAPILVEGRLWGVVVVTSRGRVPPADTERRLGDFTELVATTISNTDARAQVERLAAEQAALRRVATLVAEGGSPTMVFDGVAAEMEGLLDADQVAVSRYEPGDEVTVVALRGRVADSRLRPGTRIGHGEDSATALVRRTEKPARVEYAPGAGGLIAEFVRTRGARVSLGAPIVVDGRLWGVIQASWDQEESPPAGTEVRMAQFGKLLDTAIANADTHDQLKASRARLVAAGDEARRRMVRDLHDGVQQRLVHTIIVLKQAAHALPLNHDDVEPLLAEAIAQGTEANAELRELVHGILPAVLTRGGLAAGIDALVSRSPVPVAVTVPRERFSAEVEATAYFVVAEALTNIAKHARAQSVEVRVRIEEGALRIEVRDDGVGGADPGGDGLLGLADRIAALDGELRLESPPGGGTRITAAIRLPG